MVRGVQPNNRPINDVYDEHESANDSLFPNATSFQFGLQPPFTKSLQHDGENEDEDDDEEYGDTHLDD